jgi:hypothetical protein
MSENEIKSVGTGDGSALHPLNKFWRDKSGWHHTGAETVSEACSEGKLAVDAWNAAIDTAASCIVIDGNPAIALEKINRLRYQPNTRSSATPEKNV